MGVWSSRGRRDVGWVGLVGEREARTGYTGCRHCN